MAKIKEEKRIEQMLDEALVNESEWPYRIPDNWVWVNIEALFDITSSKRVFKDEWKRTGIPFYRAREIAELSVKDTVNNELFISNEMYIDYSNRFGVPKAGDILITAVGTLGKAYVVKEGEKLYFKDGNVIWFKKRYPQLESSLIKFYYESSYMLQKIKDISTGTVVKTYTIIKAKKTPFPLPPFIEQKRIIKNISSMLAKLKEVRELIQEAKDSFENRRAAILNKAFTGDLTQKWRYENPISDETSLKTSLETIPYKIPDQWKWVFLKDVSDKFQYGTSAKSELEGEVPVIRMGNIQHSKIDWNKLKFTSDKTEIEKYNLNFNDVLFNRTNSPALVGKTAIYKGELPAIYAGYLIRINPQKYLNPDYLNYFLNSPYSKQKCRKVKTDGVNQSNINAKKLGGFEIPIPHIKEQQEIVKILDVMFAKEITSDEIIDLEKHFDLLEKSILSKAFRGDLDTNDPKDEPAIKLLEKTLQSKKFTPAKPKTRKLRTKISAEPKTADISISIIKLSENAQRLLKEIKQYFGENRFNPDKLKDKSELSYEELKEALFELIKEPLEGKSKANLKMNWDKGYLVQLSE